MVDKYKCSSNSHCYPGTETLINKLGIKNPIELSEVERELVSFRLVEINEKPIIGSFDLEHLRKIHKYLFQDLYDWAGEVRNYNISKNGSLFCLSEYIIPYAASVFGNLKTEKYFVNGDYETKLLKLVKLFSDVNAIHPFREGNGRTQRIFIEWLAKVAGISLDLTSITKLEMILASYDSMQGRYEHMYEIFKSRSHTTSKVVQLKNIQKLLASKDRKIVEDLLEDNHDIKRKSFKI